MKGNNPTFVWASAATLGMVLVVVAFVKADAPSAQQYERLFSAADIDKDGFVTRDEFKTTFSKWFANADTVESGSVTRQQLVMAVNEELRQPVAAGEPSTARNETRKLRNFAKMLAALPASAPAEPARARKVLVLCRARGFVHPSISLAAKTIKAIGVKTGAWSTTITYAAADINTENLQQYDAIFLDNTTGAFLDDPDNPVTTASRRAALLAFVRGGKGLAAIHAASDSYHAADGALMAPDRSFGGRFVALIASGDKKANRTLCGSDLNALAEVWYDKLDPYRAGKVNEADFVTRLEPLMPPPPAGTNTVPQGPDDQIGTWPDFNNMIAGFFKFHWITPQAITVKIDDPASPLTVMFHGQEFVIHDETYTMSVHSSWSRSNVHVLTSIDYAKMSDEDKAKEEYPRADHDYGLSWIRREGQGRVFYEAHGHDESVYANTPMLEHILAGIQYAIGDLKADDSPSSK